MQRLRFLEVFVAVSLICGALPVLADQDTPAQAAARAALEQQMNQMDNGQSPGATNLAAWTNSATPPAASSAPPATPPVSMPTPQFSTNVPVNAETESEMAPAGMSQTNEPATAQMQSRTSAGTMSQTNEPATAAMQAQTNAASMSVPPAVLNTKETEQYPVNPPMAPLPPPQVETPTTSPVATEPMHPMPVPSAGQPSPAATGPSISNEPQTTNSTPAYAPISAPPLPISQEKQAELQNLLSQYMANQITPTQYQEQRAKILAEP